LLANRRNRREYFRYLSTNSLLLFHWNVDYNIGGCN
jgi:hypothetical protein